MNQTDEEGELMVTAVDLIAQIVESGYDVTLSIHRNGYYGQVWKEANEGGPRDFKQAVIMCETASTITAVVWGLYQQWKGYKEKRQSPGANRVCGSQEPSSNVQGDG